MYYQKFRELRLAEPWVKFGIQDGCRNIPNPNLGQLGEKKSLALLKAHILTECDITSKVVRRQLLLQSQKAILMILAGNL